MNNPPCTRGLKYFEEAGCPEREYNYADGTGCPLWIEKEVPTRENPQVRKKNAMCADKWTWLFQWSILGALEGNQMATETFRNAMCEPDPTNPMSAGQPKPDRAVLKLIELIEAEQKNRQTIIEHETKKLLEQQGRKTEPEKRGNGETE